MIQLISWNKIQKKIQTAIIGLLPCASLNSCFTYNHCFFSCMSSVFPSLPQMNSRLSTRGCRRTISSTCPPSNTCGQWTIRFSGGMSSWRPACGSSPDGPTESSSSSSVSVKDVTGSRRSVCQLRGQCGFQTETWLHVCFLHTLFLLLFL